MANKHTAAAVGKELDRQLALSSLKSIVDFEKTNGKAKTLEEYGGVSNAKRVTLNYNYKSTEGLCDVDWMLTIAPICRGAAAVDSVNILLGLQLIGEDEAARMRMISCGGVYAVGKLVWNTTRFIGGATEGKLDWERFPLTDSTILEEGNRNAPVVASIWLNTRRSLGQLFAPALGELKK